MLIGLLEINCEVFSFIPLSAEVTETFPRLLFLILVGGRSNSRLNWRRLGSISACICLTLFSKSSAFLGLSSGFGEVAKNTISTNFSGTFDFMELILGMRSLTCL